MYLYLNSFGLSLHVENELFLLYHKDGKQIIEPSKIKNIYVCKGVTLTSDAILLAIKHEIDIVFLDKAGNAEGRIWSYKFGSISTIRQKQVEFVYSKHSVKWIKDIIIKKIENQVALLYSLAAKIKSTNLLNDNYFLKTINSLTDYIEKVKKIESNNVYDIAPSLRGWEGIATKRYFGMISNLLPAGYNFKERTQHPAYDVVNCLLNYGYGLLYSKIESSLIKAGIDPYLGVFHRENYNRPVLAFDIIELFRIWVDYVVFDMCLQNVVTLDWFYINENGTYWLENPGKRILIQSINDYLDDTIEYKNKNITRNNYIENYCYELADMFINFK